MLHFESFRVSLCLLQSESVSHPEALLQPFKKNGQKDIAEELEWGKKKVEINVRRMERKKTLIL